jgi:hypothetical protein
MTAADAGTHATTTATQGAPGATDATSPRRMWPWVLLALAVLFVAAVVAGVLLLGDTLDQLLGGLDVHVDGERLLTLPRGEAAWWAVGAAVLAAMVVLVVVPLTLLLALTLTALVLVAALVLTLAAGALALSPLWVLALLLWLALRKPRLAAGSLPISSAPAPGAQAA